MKIQSIFDPPVWVHFPSAENATKISDAETALNLLAQIPIVGEPVMEAALDSCSAAIQDPPFAVHARLDFLKFVKAYGILASDHAPNQEKRAVRNTSTTKDQSIAPSSNSA